MPRLLRIVSLTLALLLGLALAGCTGSTEEPESEGKTPEQVMAEAKQILDDTAGVELDLNTEDLPEGVDGVRRATGYANHQPAFEGTITAGLTLLGGNEVDIPVVAVDDEVHAKIPPLPVYQEVDPDDYGVPDPAALLSPDQGVSSLLVATTDLEQGEQVRGGENNDEVFTEYTGKLPAEAVAGVIPSASGDDFDVTYTIADNGELREAVITGSFYPDADTNTYQLKLSGYGTEKTVTAP